MIKKSLLKITAILVIIALNWSGLLAVIDTVAYYNDTENSFGNSFTAATLDFSLSPLGNFSPVVIPTQSSSRTISVINNGSLGFQYTVQASNFNGDLNFCNALNLNANVDGDDPEYNGHITTFNINSPITFGSPEDWIFTVALTSNDPSLQGKVCTFDFVFNGVQIGGFGFSDQETISNIVTAGSWQSVWIQTTYDDFNSGTKSNVTILQSGDVTLAITGSSSVNLSIGKTATADSYPVGHEPNNAIDNNNNTYWQGTSSGIGWLKVNLGATYLINKIDLDFTNPKPQIPKDYQLQVSTDALCGDNLFNTWTTILSISGNNDGYKTHSFSPPVSARCVRIYITATGQKGDGQPAIEEFKIFAPIYSTSSGTLTSQKFDSGQISKWQTLEWDKTTPTDTDITLEVATSNDGSTWSTWQLRSSNSPIDLSSLPETPYIKWNATLTTNDASKTPTLHEVRILYSPGLAKEYIVLNEFLPNPSGTNPDYGFDFGEDNDLIPKGEWVEIYNKEGGEPVDLSGWYIKDQEGNIVYITSLNINTNSTVIGANGSGSEWLVVYMNREVLNNNGDTIYLYDLFGNLIDSYSYTLSDNCILEPTPGDSNNENPSGNCATEVPGNKSYARIPDGIGPWYDPIPTPGKQNKLEEIITEENQEVGLIEEIDETIDEIVNGTIEEILPEEEPIIEEVILIEEIEENLVPSTEDKGTEQVIETITNEIPIIEAAENPPATETEIISAPENNSSDISTSENSSVSESNGGESSNSDTGTANAESGSASADSGTSADSGSAAASGDSASQ